MRRLLAILGLLATTCVNAGDTVADLTIKSIASGWGGEGFYLTVNETFDYVENCTGSRFYLRTDHPMFKEVTSVLLMAKAQNSKVDIYVEGCIADNVIHKLEAVNLKD